jgi:enolase-phosphatase E1
MIRFSGRAFLLDVEGTTSSVSYVYDVLFPYARRRLRDFLTDNWDEPQVGQARELIARDAGSSSYAAFAASMTGATEPSASQQLEMLASHLERLMETDAKATGLKDLQGLIWRDGFLSGLLTSHVYPDVAPALAAWTAAGRETRIFSSGSVAAQRLFMAHSVAGDLSGYLSGHYDTTIGPKREASSYAAIAAEMGQLPAEILFVSDVVAELDAARAAGMQTALSVRPGNAPQPADHGHAVIESFAQIQLA